MVQFVFTPWRNRAELLKVRSQLYPPSSRDAPPTPHHKWTAAELQGMQAAIARVFMWVHRGNCPHVVESTAMLMSAVLLDRRHTRRRDDQYHHHQEDRSSSSSSSSTTTDDAASEYGVRAAYLTAFTRFVTGLLDGHQDRARKLSMYGVAKTVGLPAAFVELRHQGTHEPMPGLAQLRPAAGRALVWIWEYYWRNLPADGDGPGQDGDGAGETRGVPSSGTPAPAAGAGAGAALDGAAGKRQPVVPTVAAATSTIKGRMCRAALMGYLQRQEGEVGGDAAKQALTRQLGQWDGVLVLRTLEEIGQTARDAGILSRSVKLSREVLLRATGDDTQQGEDREIPTDIEEMRRELREAREEAEGSVGSIDGGKRKRDSADHDGPGWKRWKGPWAPRPIGIL
ncbi:putative hydroxyacylglutathione hydrolase [Diaporthe ampelina]|uniref:Putative hydroxyacylglutathione hydrolase n=1 Tax=Diaporthe ampelina TaxID=1214573 RepID=A0A0G2HP65_9PEZI|nr:putative hydroxyacylglutathione hydrolase [Diaporthe ampelina]